MKRIRSEKGAALLEAAITVPIILLICVGIFEFGRAYQTQQVLVNASREGARIAVIEGTSNEAIIARVTDYLKGGGIVNDKNKDAIKVLVNRSVAFSGTTASTVEVDFPFEFIVLNPVVRLIAPSDDKLGKSFTMKATTLMRNE